MPTPVIIARGAPATFLLTILFIDINCGYNRIKFEVETTLPDSNLENNVIYFDILEGVTIWGRVYERDLFGNQKTAFYAMMNVDSEHDTLFQKYSFGFSFLMSP